MNGETSRASRTNRGMLLVIIVILVGTSCLSREGDFPLGRECSATGDCATDLVCRFGRCRPTCSFDRDCPVGSVCVTTDSNGDDDPRVCTVPAESGCAPGERDICPVPWLCGSDGFCRNDCPASGCPAGYVCQPEVNVCADATGDEVTSDGGPGCQHETCDLWPQCGCGPDQGCDLDPNLERRCVRAGTTVSGEIPTQDNPCALGFTASKPSDWVSYLPAVCYHFCNADHECRDNVGTRSRCTNYLTIESVTFLNIRVCSLDCDPITPSASGGCLEYTHCRLHYDLSQPELTRTDCLAGHGRSLTDSGGSCSAHHNCTPSTTCHEGFCRRLCTETSPPGTCSPGTHCEPLEPTIRLGDETYGVCLP